jgi:hypothetical protein
MRILKGTPLTPIERKFLSTLVASGTRFMVVGMSAADLQGASIGTQDIDLWLKSTSDGGLDKAAQAVGSLFIWRANPPTFSSQDLERIDIVRSCSGLGPYDKEYDNTLNMDIEGIPVKVLPLERVIASKRVANRSKDVAHLPTLEAVLLSNRYMRRFGRPR